MGTDDQPELVLEGPIPQIHEALGAKFAPFGGWRMPLSYSGVVSEHTAVREKVGIFDVSHLGKALVAGPGAAEFVNRTLSNDLARIRPGKAQYTLCLAPDGGVIDDLIAYYVSDEEIFLVPNAANTASVVAALQAVAPPEIQVTDEHRDYAVFAVQGPLAKEAVERAGFAVPEEYMAYTEETWDGSAGKQAPVKVCRTGYTGEQGYEVIPPWSVASEVFTALLNEVQKLGGEPAGLGARDTLRTEMGYALHGHELALDISPVQAGVAWAIGWKKPEFFGREAVVAEKERGPARTLLGLKALESGVPRRGYTVRKGEASVGEVTSGTFSPTLKTGVALALVDSASGVEVGDEVSIDVRGRALRCEVVTPPFVESHVR
ncbi:glycine cleavage system aminomethyltransferase GcvT [Segniliparus rugosus]|uniref:Aminomethyltransferase n=1 Tax=Segniliparus rugosus (strain ATCC BAA-974 / DSM 45345 / CCUG 50838 / CIP 108380 / JCM 13579 / CDC 945) TaxID=679197 RepID=E5XRZ8_SEGRC|nr:glycine cleavage system aminomethyltransferase GcvT [Segniliparus rugosus]EFV12783.1 glycine cleavage system T protein [Segniliparus rugosus ATCC BAA-974]